jgi:hypothetical protein
LLLEVLSGANALSGAAITSGTPTSGVTYQMGNVGGSSDFSASGAATTANGVVFKADGDAPGAWDGAILRPVNSYALTLPDPNYNMTVSGAIPTYGHKGNNSYWAFDGVDDLVTYAYTTASSSFVLWIYPTVTNKLWVNMGTNMTIGIDGSNVLTLGSAFTNPTTYVNGSASNAVTLNAWNYIVIKSDAITPTTLQFGYVSSSYGSFNLKGFMAFNYGLDATGAAYYSDPINHLKLVDKTATGTAIDLIAGAGFTSGWATSNATINDANTFTTSGAGFIKKEIGMVVGRKYRIVIAGTTTSSDFKIYNYGATVIYSDLNTGSFSGTVEITALDAGLYLRNSDAGQTDFTTFTITELGCVLNLTAEGMYTGLWRDAYHGIDVSVGRGSTVPRLMKNLLNAWRFDGTDDYLTKASATDGLTGDITISCWFYTTTLGENSTYGVGTIFSNAGVKCHTYVGYKILFSRDDESTSALSGESKYTLNQWTHLLITSTSTGVSNMYVNGILASAADISAGTPVSGTTYRIGEISTGTRAFHGIIEDFKIYHRILSAEEIALSYDVYED